MSPELLIRNKEKQVLRGRYERGDHEKVVCPCPARIDKDDAIKMQRFN